jgi:hypothetical protein
MQDQSVPFRNPFGNYTRPEESLVLFLTSVLSVDGLFRFATTSETNANYFATSISSSTANAPLPPPLASSTSSAL